MLLRSQDVWACDDIKNGISRKQRARGVGDDPHVSSLHLPRPPPVMADIQTLRFRRPIERDKNEYAPKPVAARHTGILQDQLRRCVRVHALAINAFSRSHSRAARPPWVPRFSVAVRILLIFRVTAAMYSNIQDCDEGLSLALEPLCFE
jgi:hypothetical protein